MILPGLLPLSLIALVDFEILADDQ